MAYEYLMSQLQASSANFVGSLLNGVFAFCILVIVMLIGIWVANLLGQVLKEFFRRVKLEKFLESHGVHDAFLGFTLSGIAIIMLKLYIVVAFLGIAADMIQMPMLFMLAAQAIGYLPSLAQGLVILLVALMAADYLTDRIKESKKLPFANGIGIIVTLFIAYNALVIAMPLLLPAADPSLLVWSFLVLLSAFAIALGFGAAIAIGLGMKDTVAEIAKKNRDKFSRLL
ncbi:MAG: hypothetical protein NTX79_05010 [Candidatus Micrarchaeota archaeon]|nr:hypothetical protein [Candidatus Micrarchaeota archaeon]